MKPPAHSIGHRQSFKLGIHDREALRRRQGLQQQAEIPLGFGFVMHRGVKGFGQIVEGLEEALAAPAPPPQVDELVARDAMHPGGHRDACVVGATLQMQCQQGFLHQILHVLRKAGHPARKVATQAISHQAQGLPIRGLVPCLGLQPKRSELFFKVLLQRLFLYFAVAGCSVTPPRRKSSKRCNPGPAPRELDPQDRPQDAPSCGAR